MYHFLALWPFTTPANLSLGGGPCGWAMRRAFGDIGGSESARGLRRSWTTGGRHAADQER